MPTRRSYDDDLKGFRSRGLTGDSALRRRRRGFVARGHEGHGDQHACCCQETEQRETEAGEKESRPKACDRRGQPREGVNLSLIHISEPTRLRRISYAVFCLKK